MLLTISLTVIGCTCFYGALGLLAACRISSHLRGNAYAVGQVVDHVLIPLFSKDGRPKNDAPANIAPNDPGGAPAP